MTPRTIALVAITGLMLSNAVHGQSTPTKLDPESKTPYTWRIVLHAKPHPLLGTTFRGQVRREVIAALQPALGPLGTVEFVDLADVPKDRWDPLWRQFDERGWPALDFTGARELDGVKSHFIRLEYRDGAYRIETRQLDGFTGLPTPMVRRQETRAADAVGRITGLLLDRDFGACGTVEIPEKLGEEVTVRLRGGLLDSFDRFVSAGDVFAVVGLRKSVRPPGPPPTRTATGKLVEKPKGDLPPAFTPVQHEFTLLRALDAPKDGGVRCKVLSGYPVALPLGRGIIGYRCLRLATVAAPLSIRLVGKGGAVQNVAAARARANDVGWKVQPGGDDLELRDGIFRSAKPFDHLAYVTLSVGATRSSKVPLPVLSADPVVVPFTVSDEDDKRVRFERDCLDLARRVGETRLTQAGCFEALGRLISAQRNNDALARAKAGYQSTAADDVELTELLAALRPQATISPTATELLNACDRQLADVRKSQTELAGRIKDLEAILVRENDPVKAAQEVQAQALSTRIKVLIERGEVDEAFVVFDQLATLVPDNADVKARRDKLKAAWATKSPEHAKAREFLIKTWPALASIPDWRDNLPTLTKSVAECKTANDKLALRKFRASLADMPVKLTDLTQPLDSAIDSDRRLIADARLIRDALEKFDTELLEFLKGSEP
jgi:hypothetical protein